MQTYKIAILPWDGIGPEVMQEAVKVLEAIEKKYNVKFEKVYWLIWWAAWDKYWVHFPEETKKILDEVDAVLFWSVWWPVDKQMEPKWKDCERNSILWIRKYLNLTINIRPSKVWKELSHLSVLKPEFIPEDWVEIIVFRELSGWIYFWKHEIFVENGIRKAIDVAQYDEETIRYITEFTFKSALQNKKKITVVDKANVLDTSRLRREVVEEVAKNYPEVKYEYMYVDNCAAAMVQKPYKFEYILTENMFWDILSDLSATFSGSLGLLPSASFNRQWFWFYEPSGGSAPDIAGKWIANPIAQILCVSMMLRYSFNLNQAADDIEKAIDNVIKQWYRTQDIYTNREWEKLVTTSQMGDLIVNNL